MILEIIIIIIIIIIAGISTCDNPHFVFLSKRGYMVKNFIFSSKSMQFYSTQCTIQRWLTHMEMMKYRTKRMHKIAATTQPTTIITIDLSASGLFSSSIVAVGVGIISCMTIRDR